MVVDRLEKQQVLRVHVARSKLRWLDSADAQRPSDDRDTDTQQFDKTLAVTHVHALTYPLRPQRNPPQAPPTRLYTILQTTWPTASVSALDTFSSTSVADDSAAVAA